MITVLLIMLAGIATGFLLRQKPMVLKISGKLTSIAIYILLFLLGISVGLNKTILNHFDRIGFQAFLITLGAISGSVAVLWIVYRFLFNDTQPNLPENEE